MRHLSTRKQDPLRELQLPGSLRRYWDMPNNAAKNKSRYLPVQVSWVDSMLSFWRNRILLIFRMDFDEFRLMGPETENNICENDQFIIAGAPNSVPIICGINTGNHSEFWSIFENCFGSRVGKNCTYSIWVTEYENGKEKSTILIVFPKKIPKFQLVRWGHMYFKTVFF